MNTDIERWIMESSNHSAMIFAVRHGNISTVANLIGRHGLSCKEWSDGYNLLLEAIKCKQSGVAKLLLYKGAKVNVEGSNIIEPTLLHVAVENNEQEIVEILLQKGDTINVKAGESQCTPLHIAVRDRNIGITELLLQKGALTDISDFEDKTPLFIAIEKRFADMVKILLQRGASVNFVGTYCNIQGSTPLHVACRKGYEDMVELLLSRGAEVNAGAGEFRTPLETAVERGFREIIKVLLNRGANIDTQGPRFESPLHVAINNRDKGMVGFLLKMGARVNSEKENTLTPLSLAVERGYEDITLLLLNSGADTNPKVDDLYTPLYIAVRNGRPDLVELLLRSGADVNAEFDCRTPLHVAVEDNSDVAKDLAELLLDNGANVNAKTKDSVTPLHISIQNNCSDLVQLLLERGADVDSEDEYSNTALRLAVENGCPIILDHVLKFNPNVGNTSNQNAIISIATGVTRNKEEIFKRLLEYGFLIGPKYVTNCDIVSCVIKNGLVNIADRLFKYGTDTTMEFESMPLHVAAIHKQLGIAKVLLKHGADVNVRDMRGQTPIHFAAANADLHMFQLFLFYGAIVRDPGEILCIAARNGWLKVVKNLLDRPDCDVNCKGEKGRTALHNVIFLEALNTTSFCPVYTKRKRPNAAELNARVQIAEYLLLNGAKVNARDHDRATPLLLAAAQGSYVFFAVLLKHGANVNAFDIHGNTVLDKAVLCRCLGSTRLLIENGAKVNTDTELTFQRTPLHIATLLGDVEHVKLLLEYGADVHAVCDNGTVLHVATRQNCFNVVKLLLEYGADVNVQCEQDTALYLAARYGHTQVVKTLVEYGADVNIMSGQNTTPLECGLNDSVASRHSKDSSDFLLEHIVKMTAAGLYVSERNMQYLETESLVTHFQGSMELPERLVILMSRCHEEIEIMKDTKIADSYYTYYDILSSSAQQIVKLSGNGNLVQALNEEVCRDIFPNYASMICGRFELGKRRRQLEEESKRIFFVKCVPGLPDICMDRIMCYLTNCQLKMLVRICCPSPKPGNNIKNMKDTR